MMLATRRSMILSANSSVTRWKAFSSLKHLNIFTCSSHLQKLLISTRLCSTPKRIHFAALGKLTKGIFHLLESREMNRRDHTAGAAPSEFNCRQRQRNYPGVTRNHFALLVRKCRRGAGG